MYCKNCGAQINNVDGICPECSANNKEKSGGFMPSFILGLIGAIFGLGGGMCMTMCSSFYSSGNAAFILIFGGSIVGLIGACKCLKNVKSDGIKQKLYI